MKFVLRSLLSDEWLGPSIHGHCPAEAVELLRAYERETAPFKIWRTTALVSGRCTFHEFATAVLTCTQEGLTEYAAMKLRGFDPVVEFGRQYNWGFDGNLSIQDLVFCVYE